MTLMNTTNSDGSEVLKSNRRTILKLLTAVVAILTPLLFFTGPAFAQGSGGAVNWSNSENISQGQCGTNACTVYYYIFTDLPSNYVGPFPVSLMPYNDYCVHWQDTYNFSEVTSGYWYQVYTIDTPANDTCTDSVYWEFTWMEGSY